MPISGFCLSQNLNTGGLNIPQEQFWVRKSPDHQDDIAGNVNFAIMYVSRITCIVCENDCGYYRFCL